MHPDRWLEIKKKVIDSFELFNEFTQKDEEIRQETEILEFNGPAGKMRVEWITRPKVLDKKTNYSNRIGGSVSVAYIYSPDEFTHTFKVYRWDEPSESWNEMDASAFS